MRRVRDVRGSWPPGPAKRPKTSTLDKTIAGKMNGENADEAAEKLENAAERLSMIATDVGPKINEVSDITTQLVNPASS